MLVAYRLAGLSALEAYYAGVSARAQGCGVAYGQTPTAGHRRPLRAVGASWVREGAPASALGYNPTRPYRRCMIRIAVTPAAFEAIAATMPLGSVGYENAVNERGERFVWLSPTVVNRLRAMRGPGESCSDVILRIVGTEARVDAG
jgi:hypothetical protein